MICKFMNPITSCVKLLIFLVDILIRLISKICLHKTKYTTSFCIKGVREKIMYMCFARPDTEKDISHNQRFQSMNGYLFLQDISR